MSALVATTRIIGLSRPVHPGDLLDPDWIVDQIGLQQLDDLRASGALAPAGETPAEADDTPEPQEPQNDARGFTDLLAAMTVPQTAEHARAIAEDDHLRAQIDLLIDVIGKIETRAEDRADREDILRDALLKIIAKGDPASATKSGKVTVQALEAESGLTDINGDERGRLMAWWEEQNPGKPAFGQ